MTETQVSNFLYSHECVNNIAVDSIASIEIKDHFRTMMYCTQGQWKQWGVYGSLSEIEEVFPDQFVKINRSVLINPDYIQSIKKTGRQYLINMQGQDDWFKVSRSRNKTVQSLQLQVKALQAA